MKRIKKMTTVLVALLFLQTSFLLAQDKEENVEATSSVGGVKKIAKDPAGALKKLLKFDLAIVPDTDGNVAVGTGFNFDYFAGLNFGAAYLKSTKSLAKNKGGIKDISIIEDQLVKFKALGFKYDVIDSGSLLWTILPSVNGQTLSQKKQLNYTNSDKGTFKSEDSNLQSMQVNLEFETWLNFGPNYRLNIAFSATPYSQNKESGAGYDSARITDKDEFGNDIYAGPTGDYSYDVDSATTFMNGKLILDMKDLFGGVDFMLGATYSSLKYEYSFKANQIFNGEESTYTKKKKIDRSDIGIVLGAELAFLDFGMAVPLATINYTMSKYQNANGDTITNNIYGFGITMKN